MTRNACGTTISRNVEPRDSPSDDPGLHLSFMDRKDARTDNLGDERRGISRKRKRQRDKFRNHARTAGEIEAFEFRHFKCDRRPEQQPGNKRQTDQ